MDAHGELAEVQGRVAVPRRVLLLALVAVALTMAYAAYLQPGWESYRDDQRQYTQLAQRLVERGEFTRAPVGEAFVPEPLRTPGYPLLLAPLCATVGCGHWQIAIAQAMAFGLVVVLVYLFVRRLAPDLAFAAAGACAFYLPIAYYAALALSDFAATAVMVLAMVLVARARSLPAALGTGAVLGFVTLVRPQFALFPLAAAAAILLAREDRSARERVRPVLAILAAAALVLVPFSAYSLGSFGAPFSSSSGWVLWNGYFQGRGSDAQGIAAFRDRALGGAADAEVVASGAGVGLDPVESVQAAGAFREIAAFEAITDRRAQAYAWLDLDRSLARRATTLIAHDPIGWAERGITFRSIELWTGEIPMRVDDFHLLPALPRLVSMAVQLVLFVAGVAGAVLLALRRDRAGLLVAAVILYTWFESIVFVTEPRYSLPARPALVIAAVYAVAAYASSRLGYQKARAARTVAA